MKALLGHGSRPRRRSSAAPESGDGGELDGNAPPCPAPPAFTPRLAGWAGVPESADAIAYANGRAYLAAACPDGRLLIAAPPDGRQVSLGPYADPSAPTLALTFLFGAAGLVRATAAGLECWATPPGLFYGDHHPPVAALPRRAVARAPAGGPALTAAAVLDPTLPPERSGTTASFIAVGRVDGSIAVARAACDAGGACALAWTGYELSAADLGRPVGTPVTALTCSGDGSHLVAVHEGAGVTAWDVRREAVAATVAAPDATAASGAVWNDADEGGRACFLVGTSDGRVRLYEWRAREEMGGARLPGGGRGGGGGAAPPVATLRGTHHVPAAGGGHPPGPVRALKHVADGLAVWGTTTPASAAAAIAPPPPPPAEVVFLALPGAYPSLGVAPGPEAVAQLPATAAPLFGPTQSVCVAADAGPPPPAGAVLVLSRGGQVLAHDPGVGMAPAPVGLPAQALPEVSAAAVVPAGGAAAAALGPMRAAASVRGVSPLSAGWRTPLRAWRLPPGATLPPRARAASAAAEAATSLVFTGHVDGRLRVWAGCDLLDASPWGGLAHRAAARPVTALAACPAAGLAVTGHVRGLATVHQFSSTSRAVAVASLAAGGPPPAEEAPPPPPPTQPPGWQVVATVEVAAAAASPSPPAITAVALDGRRAVVALGDDVGGVAVLALAAARPAVAWRAPRAAPGGGGVAALTFFDLCGSDAPALLVGSADGGLALLDAATGEALPTGVSAALGGGSAVVAAVPLGADGAPFHSPPPAVRAALQWTAAVDGGAADAGHLGAAPAQPPPAVEVAGEPAPAEPVAEQATTAQPPAPEPAPPPPPQRPPPSSPPPAPASLSASSSESDLLAAAVAAAEEERKAPRKQRRPRRGSEEAGGGGGAAVPAAAATEQPPPPPPATGPGAASVAVATADGRVRVERLVGDTAAAGPAVDLAAATRAAWPFAAGDGGGAPALAVLGEDGALRALALPALTPLSPAAGVRLDAALGLADAGGAGPALVAASHGGDGGALLVGQAGSWVRVVVGGPGPPAAACAEEEEEEGQPPPPPPPPPPPIRAAPPPPQVEAAPPRQPRSRLTPLSLVEAAVSVAVGAAFGPSAPEAPPTMESVLSGPRVATAAPARATVPDARRAAATAAVAAPPPPPTDAAAAAARAALFAGASRPAGRGGQPAPRSAAEVRAKYGRPLPGDSGGGGGEARARGAGAAVASVLSEAAAALGRRGDAIVGLQDATATLADDAASFEAMARAVRARAEGRKWWQLF